MAEHLSITDPESALTIEEARERGLVPDPQLPGYVDRMVRVGNAYFPNWSEFRQYLRMRYKLGVNTLKRVLLPTGVRQGILDASHEAGAQRMMRGLHLDAGIAQPTITIEMYNAMQERRATRDA